MSAAFALRFWAKVQESTERSFAGLPCWEWTAARQRKGYGIVRGPGSGNLVAHRAAYEMLVDSIPEGLQLDHLCKFTSCVNPWHLDPVTPSINSKRAQASRRERSQCVNGHEFNESNDYFRPRTGWRQCVPCSRERMRRGRASR